MSLESLGVCVGIAFVAALAGHLWEHFWRRQDAKTERIAACDHDVYFLSLYDQGAAFEWSRHCKKGCGWQEPWREAYPPTGAVVRTRKAEFTWRKPHD